ncbi:hypothetical protein [Candidatus Uabimicrobium amorphum]|uniref:Uncharacterized protein n=1 Tax=Uabimicrobium amorphum TaxID=2596890 RepID=A0A5S9F391_UABAM|nr:hypothetical protein [Candidatus Uabimicrobium amorphum]BBM84487.1 hypothetical protein UABAM_02848 [Candidatus Uabimicrobium amorphum]
MLSELSKLLLLWLKKKRCDVCWKKGKLYIHGQGKFCKECIAHNMKYEMEVR